RGVDARPFRLPGGATGGSGGAARRRTGGGARAPPGAGGGGGGGGRNSSPGGRPPPGRPGGSPPPRPTGPPPMAPRAPPRGAGRGEAILGWLSSVAKLIYEVQRPSLSGIYYEASLGADWRATLSVVTAAVAEDNRLGTHSAHWSGGVKLRCGGTTAADFPPP